MYDNGSKCFASPHLLAGHHLIFHKDQKKGKIVREDSKEFGAYLETVTYIFVDLKQHVLMKKPNVLYG